MIDTKKIYEQLEQNIADIQRTLGQRETVSVDISKSEARITTLNLFGDEAEEGSYCRNCEP